MNLTPHWPYYEFRNGRLIDESGDDAFPLATDFADWQEACDWLERNDIPGTVR